MDKNINKDIDTTLYNEKSLYLLNIRELRDMGRKFGVPSPTTMKKQDLIEYILKIVYGEVSAPVRNNYGRPNVREFDMNQYLNKIKKNADITDELLKVKLYGHNETIGALKLAAPSNEDPVLDIQNRVYVEEEGKCLLKIHAFVSSNKDIEIDKSLADKLGLENYDVVEALIDGDLFKIITINGISKKDKFENFVIDNQKAKTGKTNIFKISTKEELNDKIEKIADICEQNDLKLLIFENKKYTEKCTEFVEYDINDDFSKMYKDFMKFLGLCEKSMYDGEDIVIVFESMIDIDQMVNSFEEDVYERVNSNINQMFDKFLALGNLVVSFRTETVRSY